MASFKTISLAAAPQAPTAQTALRRRMSEYDAYLASISSDEVGILEPDEDETAFALAQRIARAVESWVVDGKLYFSDEGGAPAGNPQPTVELAKKPRGRTKK